MQYVLFFFNDTATTEIYTLSLHDALPIYLLPASEAPQHTFLQHAQQLHLRRGHHLRDLIEEQRAAVRELEHADRKSTRLNSSHANISYAVFCLKKKNYINVSLTNHLYNSH